ncbi:M56 family metallopeptidase [Proteiniborus sp. MB09-C3]|nr:M56 family metallopeptidase [Proteiniborus sp. MB09-C3]WIV13967.1 M56 family metallopeptidase [Proteiniborus sp. MB09-C3]
MYLPANLTETEKPYIIQHEQTHIKRHDHIIKFLAFLVVSVH